jgi:hypothetical protein
MDPNLFADDFLSDITQLQAEGQTFCLYFPTSEVIMPTNNWSEKVKKLIEETKYPQEFIFRLQELK